MSKKLKIKDYNDKYGSLPKDFHDRFIYLWDTLKIKAKDIPVLQKRIRYILSIKKTTISFVFYFIPEATPRPRYSRFTKSYYVKNATNYGKLFENFIEECKDLETLTTPCEFSCITYKPTPSAMNRYDTIISELGLIKDISKPDWDNLAKTYCDMVQHGLLLDDSIIYKGTLEKNYSIYPRIEITLKYYNTHDSTYNQNKINKIINRKGQ